MPTETAVPYITEYGAVRPYYSVRIPGFNRKFWLFQINLARALFLRWTGFENMRQIVRNMGFRNRVVYYADESVIKCDEEGLTNYYRTFNALREPDLIARHALKYFSETVFRYAQLLYDAKLDETELVAFLMLHMLRFGKHS